MTSGNDSDSVNVLAVGAHPDDVELGAGGTICSLTASGHAVAIVDLTLGELGSRGSADQRRREASEAARILGVAARVNLEIPDGDIRNTPENRLRLIREIRRFRPRILLVGSETCRHPDHGAATRLAISAAFYAGLPRIESHGGGGTPQKPHRPDHVLHYMQAIPFEPTVAVDVSDHWDQKLQAIRAFKSQFFNPDYKADVDEPETYVSNQGFFRWVEARARTYGYPIGAEYAEPFLYRHGPIGVNDLTSFLGRTRAFK